jgi:hypothetical protein
MYHHLLPCINRCGAFSLSNQLEHVGTLLDMLCTRTRLCPHKEDAETTIHHVLQDAWAMDPPLENFGG